MLARQQTPNNHLIVFSYPTYSPTAKDRVNEGSRYVERTREPWKHSRQAPGSSGPVKRSKNRNVRNIAVCRQKSSNDVNKYINVYYGTLFMLILQSAIVNVSASYHPRRPYTLLRKPIILKAATKYELWKTGSRQLHNKYVIYKYLKAPACNYLTVSTQAHKYMPCTHTIGCVVQSG